MTWIIKKINKIPTHCDVVYENVCSLARGHVIRMCAFMVKNGRAKCKVLWPLLYDLYPFWY